MDRHKHILSSLQFDLSFFVNLYKDTILIRDLMKTREGKELLTHVLPGYVIGEMFWQESSRTFHSFSAAARRLGAGVESERGVQRTSIKDGKKVSKWELVFSSEMKDAHFEDEVRAWASFYDAMILRTAEEGLVARAAAICDEFEYDVHIINAGDGKGEHPTQTFLDVFSLLSGLGFDIKRDWSKLKNHSVAFINDPRNSRTIHSLARALGSKKLFGMSLIFISRPGFEIPQSLRKEFIAEDYDFLETHELAPADAYYVTRNQVEYGAEAQCFSITPKVADDYGVKIIMHPFPRSKNGNELPIWLPSKPETHSVSLDKDPRAMYFKQMEFGVPVRMALLKYLLNPHLELQKLAEERLKSLPIGQCISCGKIQFSGSLGWTEGHTNKIRTLSQIFCDKC